MSLEAFVASNSSKDGEGFLGVARLIAGDNPPKWFVRFLREWSSSVMLDGMVQARQLGKAEARARLQKLSEAVELTERELHDPEVVRLLTSAEFDPLPVQAGIDVVLREIGHRADAASSRMELLATGFDVRLEELCDALKLIVRELQDPELSGLLKAEQIVGPQPKSKLLDTLLREIKQQVNAALLSPYLVNEAGQAKAGRRRALPPAASTPQAFCAAIILEAWAYFHDGEYPRASNHQPLWKAAEEYWKASGGITGGAGNSRLPAWRRHFKEAGEPPLEGLRIELQRVMRLSSEFDY